MVDATTTHARSFRLQIFIRAPFDTYVRPQSLFWNASAVRISLGGDGISGQLASAQAALGGGIAFDTPMEALGDDLPRTMRCSRCSVAKIVRARVRMARRSSTTPSSGARAGNFRSARRCN